MGMVANRRATLHTGMVQAEWLAGVAEGHRAVGTLAEIALRSAQNVRQPEARGREMRIEAVVGARIGGERRVLARSAQPLNVRTAGRDRRPVVGLAVKDPDRTIRHVL